MISEWAGLAAAGGLGGLIAAIVHFATFWLKRGQAEGRSEDSAHRVDRQLAELIEGREQYRRELDIKYAALHGTMTLHHDEMLRDYVHKTDLTQFESRFMGAQKDIGDRLSTEIRSLGDRLDKRIDKLNGVH